MLNWIKEHFSQINGYGSYIEGESGMYVVVPVTLIAEEYDISIHNIIYGSDDDE